MNNLRRKQIIKGIIALSISILYLANPTAGVFEFIPDVLPIVGNLDEATATTLLLYGLGQLRGSQTPVISLN